MQKVSKVVGMVKKDAKLEGVWVVCARERARESKRGAWEQKVRKKVTGGGADGMDGCKWVMR